jgi:beta-mannanase
LGPKLTRFKKATRVQPQIVAQYLKFGDPYNAAEACSVAQAGAELLIQWDPKRISLQRIANGRSDHYITQFAHNVQAEQVPIVLSFGHEMNGNWYRWGYTRASPKRFIAAWRHLHRLFTRAGARNVTWCWDANTWDPALAGRAPGYGIGPPRWWWPGAQYVNWIGLDAYYARPTDTFRTVFQYPLRALHGIAHNKPVLIAETGAAAGPWQARQIRTLFSGLRRINVNVIGAVWFDGKGRFNWRLEGHPAAIAAFRAGARSLRNG